MCAKVTRKEYKLLYEQLQADYDKLGEDALLKGYEYGKQHAELMDELARVRSIKEECERELAQARTLLAGAARRQAKMAQNHEWLTNLATVLWSAAHTINQKRLDNDAHVGEWSLTEDWERLMGALYNVGVSPILSGELEALREYRRKHPDPANSLVDKTDTPI